MSTSPSMVLSWRATSRSSITVPAGSTQANRSPISVPTAREAAGSTCPSILVSAKWRCVVRRHELDVVSLVFGLFFAMVALLWPLWQLDVLDNNSLSWLPALALVVIGLLGVTLSIMRSRRPLEELERS